MKKILLFTAVNVIVIITAILLMAERPQVVGVNRVELMDRSGDTLYIKMELRIHNNNFYSLSGKEVTITSRSGDVVLGTGTISEFGIGGHDTGTVEVVLTVGSDAMLKAYQASKDDFPNSLVIDGSFWPLFFVSSVETEAGIDGAEMKQLLVESFFANNNLSFDSLNYTPVSGVESKMDFIVTMENKFGFNFTVQEMNVEVLPMEGSNTLMGTWNLEKDVMMKPGEPIVLPGSMTVHHMAIMLAGLEKGGKNLNTAWVDGTVTVLVDEDPFEIPFGFNVSADMSKLKINKDAQ